VWRQQSRQKVPDDQSRQKVPDDHLETLKVAYEEVRQERDRIRNARGWASRQLGPLPSAAGISTGVVAAFSGHVNRWWLYGALVGLAAMVIVSMLYSRVQAYRQMVAEKQSGWDTELDRAHRELAEQARSRELKTEDLLPAVDWYSTMIARERRLYGGRNCKRSRDWRWLPLRHPTNLQDAFDRERVGVFTVQFLFVIVIACLVLSRLL
jgi:hypothetical protein